MTNESSLHDRSASLPQRCWLVLDASTSMTGERVKCLNEGLKLFAKTIRTHTRLSSLVCLGIISFGDSAIIECPLTLADQWEPPELIPQGSTRLVLGLHTALDELAQGLKEGAGDWVVLITDGVPNYDEEISSLITRLESLYRRKAVRLIAVVVNGTDPTVLLKLTHPEAPPYRLRDLRFDRLFTWLVDVLAEPGCFPGSLPSALAWDQPISLNPTKPCKQ